MVGRELLIVRLGKIVLVIGLTQPRTTLEGSFSEGLFQLGRSIGMSVEGLY